MSPIELSLPQQRSTVFAAFNAGLALLVGGLIVAKIAVCVVASAIIGVAGLMYSAATLWTLSFAYRRGET
jgi:hypothetical protein